MEKILLIIYVAVLVYFHFDGTKAVGKNENFFWEIQSIDTMKYSRDLAREQNKSDEFDEVIETQIKNIADMGATYVAIATPYDDEFNPFLRKWVRSARDHKLSVWFRGNLSGWEGWFGYPEITREEHKKLINSFIYNNPDLFEDGDIITSCTECENGGPGDPRITGDVKGFRNFLIEEHQMTEEIFAALNKKVYTNFYSMNGDVAKLVMDESTTEKLNGVIVIDHYVKSPETLASDIEELSELTGAKIVLGEFGVPVPDIHGNISEQDQADWINQALFLLSQNPAVIGINYWVNVGGTTEIWDTNGDEKLALSALRTYYKPNIIRGMVTNELERPVGGALVTMGLRTVKTEDNGEFSIAQVPSSGNLITISARGYENFEYIIQNEENIELSLIREKEDYVFYIIKTIYQLFRSPYSLLRSPEYDIIP